MNKNLLTKKREHLFSILEEYGALVVAYSGGVDSSFLLAVAHEALKKNLVAVTASSPVHPEWERRSATAFARQLCIGGINQPFLVFDDEIPDLFPFLHLEMADPCGHIHCKIGIAVEPICQHIHIPLQRSEMSPYHFQAEVGGQYMIP